MPFKEGDGGKNMLGRNPKIFRGEVDGIDIFLLALLSAPSREKFYCTTDANAVITQGN